MKEKIVPIVVLFATQYVQFWYASNNIITELMLHRNEVI